MLAVSGVTKVSAASRPSTSVPSEGKEGEILGLIGRMIGQEHHVQSHRWRACTATGSIRFLGREIGGWPAYRVAHAGIGRTFQIPRPFRRLSIIENVALAACYGQTDRPTREQAFSQAKEILDLVRLRAEAGSRVEGLGAAGLKKLELARALATRPKLLLADESLGGLDEQEMNQAADLLAEIRKQRGITIVWVEHIMGALMRVVDRCVVLDHAK